MLPLELIQLIAEDSRSEVNTIAVLASLQTINYNSTIVQLVNKWKILRELFINEDTSAILDYIFRNEVSLDTVSIIIDSIWKNNPNLQLEDSYSTLLTLGMRPSKAQLLFLLSMNLHRAGNSISQILKISSIEAIADIMSEIPQFDLIRWVDGLLYLSKPDASIRRTVTLLFIRLHPIILKFVSQYQPYFRRRHLSIRYEYAKSDIEGILNYLRILISGKCDIDLINSLENISVLLINLCGKSCFRYHRLELYNVLSWGTRIKFRCAKMSTKLINSAKKVGFAPNIWNYILY